MAWWNHTAGATPEAAATDDDAVAAGGAHHPDGVDGLPDVAVAQHRDRCHVGLELGDGVPAGVPGVVLLHRASVHRDGHDALVGADLTGPQVGDHPVVQPDAELGRDRDAVRHPKLRSMWSTSPESHTRSTARPIIAGSDP